MMEHLELAVPTLFGLEGLAAEELRRLGLTDVRPENGRVLCGARAADIPRLNLNLRTGERVLLVLGSFPAGDFDALFEGTRALPWEDLIPRNGAFPVKGHCLNSALHAVPACQAIIKKAVAARLGGAYGLDKLPETGPLYQIQFSLMKDTAVLMLDTDVYKRQALGVPLQQRRRQPGRLFPEKEPAAVPVRRVAVPARRPGGGEPQVRLGIPGKKIIQGRIDVYVHQIDVYKRQHRRPCG